MGSAATGRAAGSDRGPGRFGWRLAPREQAALEAFRESNTSRSECVVYHLSTRGLFAELSDVARAMVYAQSEGLRLVLDASRFAYRVDRGWDDWFLPICPDAGEVDPRRIVRRFEFDPLGPDRKPVRRLQLYRARELCLGDLRLTDFGAMHDLCWRLLFQPRPEVVAEIEALLAPLALPERYVALHVRRGDKIGDEDVFYPAELYLQRLPELLAGETVFVMTDEHAAVAEVERALARRGADARVASLSSPDDSGFDVGLLRGGGAFLSRADHGRAAREPSDTGQGYLRGSTLRLLAETCVALHARAVVATERSFVGKGLRALSGPRDRVALLQPHDSAGFVPAKLPAGRTVLDAYSKVLRIRIGHYGAGFFAYVQYALNQARYCERHGFLPVVDYDGSYRNHFHDPAVGDDVWSYWFEPVAGYSRADLDRMLADPDDPLTADHVVSLSDDEILRLCQFDPSSIYHYTYGYWREHPPDDPEAWYAEMRDRGHRAVAGFVKVKPAIEEEVEEFVAAHFRGHRVLGVHARGTDMRYAPPVPLSRFVEEIDRRLERGFDRVFLATDQQQYVEALRARYGDTLVSRDCLRSTDGRNPMWLADRSPSEQGKDVLIDALLLSRSGFLLKSPSAVSEFAHYFRPTLRSLDLNGHRTQVLGQDYAMPGLGYGRYPKAWDLVGDEVAPAEPAPRAVWVSPRIGRAPR